MVVLKFWFNGYLKKKIKYKVDIFYIDNLNDIKKGDIGYF